MNLDNDKPRETQSNAEPHDLVAEMAELAGGLAHELRNPLSTMMIQLRLLAEDLEDLETHPLDARRRASLKVEVLKREAQRLQNLFDEFLSLAGPCRLGLVDVDVNKIVARLATFIEPEAKSRGIEVKLSLADQPLVCPVDDNLLRQALLNIIINAREAMPRGGVLRLATGTRGDQAIVAISDTGVGIAPDDHDRILRPFFSTKVRGSGLGLSVTQRIIHEHRGSLSFQSNPGQGTTFTIVLPHSRHSDSDRPAAGP
ncbi:MAG: ATP-binding protein [Phycisphaerae bacterium]